ncbi:N-acetyltransferase [Streptomyces sp. FH025]|uniref:GNAT family N-acetyltransferase n=1 Tax=Streptomyces sp. FH025 TaxID=2815937 RepID=UPI001A9DD526|nr:GNAT family N-acetyltransferase [Streptomyces sp. FH025]MBO1418634.1 GNAT family N-acetyltransferase [Streptomyces sp. FH025]
MTVDWNGTELGFERAGLDRMDEVLGVLDDAAGWLGSRGVDQWPARFEAAFVEPALSRGETWLVRSGGEVAGTVTMDWADKLWADSPGEAGYLHRLAVRRSAAGLGARILDWAADAVRTRGADYLRLDCVAGNARLRAYYEGRGFAPRGVVAVEGAPDRRTGEKPVYRLSRYELAVPGRDGHHRA